MLIKGLKNTFISFTFLLFVGLSKPTFSQITITTPNPNYSAKWDIYELTFVGNDGNFTNPFWDVEISGTFTGPNAEIIKREGFYFDKNTWKLRFSPISEGLWQYQIQFKSTTNTQTFSGSMNCLAAKPNNHGFITTNASNQHTFKYSDGSNLIVNGINGHTPPVTAALIGIPNGNVTLDSIMTSVMWDSLAAHNINTYRLQMFHQSWAPPVMSWNTYEGHANLLQNTNSLDKYDLKNAKLIDKWFEKAASLGINLYPCLYTIHDDANVFKFNQSRWSVDSGGFYTSCTNMYSSTTLPGHEYVKKYVRYLVNRYGAFQNILGWEYNNEWGKYTSKNWINSIDTVITRSDPYNRAHVVSYWGYDFCYDSELHNLSSNDIIDFHVYPWIGPYNEYNIDSLITKQVNYFYTRFNKPINIGELGSGDFQNNIPESGLYYDRVGYWASFISGGSTMYWLRGDNTTSGNIYNRKSLDWIKSFGTITSNIKDFKSFVPQKNITTSDNPNVRAYLMGAKNEFISYLHHYSDHSTNISNVMLQVTVPVSTWEINWFDPNSGFLILKDTIQSSNGIMNISVPTFRIDLALYVKSLIPLGNGIESKKLVKFNNISPNPFTEKTKIEFEIANNSNVNVTVHDITGKKIKTLLKNNLNPGQYFIQWDGTNDNNDYITNGLYFLKLECDGNTEVMKVVFIK